MPQSNTAVAPTLTVTPNTQLETSTPTINPFQVIKTASRSGSVVDIDLADNGRFAIVIRDNKLSLYDRFLDEASLIGSNSGQVLSAAISPDGQTVAYWATVKSLNDIPAADECENPDSPYCGTFFIYNIATETTNSIPFGIQVAPGEPTPSVSVANNGTIAMSGNGIIHSGTFLLNPEGELLPISNEAIGVSLSSNGRYLAYITSTGIFIYDVETGTTEKVTTEWPDVFPFHETATSQVDLSDNGRFVLFTSIANLANVPLSPCTHYFEQQLPFCRHVYLIDRELNQTELISVATNGQPANDVSESAYISSDGRFVVFDSFANNLTDLPICTEKFDRCPQVYLRDRQKEQTYLLSQPIDGQLADDGSFVFTITSDGAYVGIISGATNLSDSTISTPYYNRQGLIVDASNRIEIAQILSAASVTPEPTASALPAQAEIPGWTWYEDAEASFTIAYPQTWIIKPGHKPGQTIFSSPETNSEVRIDTWSAAANDWLDTVQQDPHRYIYSVTPAIYDHQCHCHRATCLFPLSALVSRGR